MWATRTKIRNQAATRGTNRRWRIELAPGVAGPYHCPPATSREDETEICLICGYVEVIDALPLIDEEKEKIINVFIRAELEVGRIERSEPEVAAIKNRRVKKK